MMAAALTTLLGLLPLVAQSYQTGSQNEAVKDFASSLQPGGFVKIQSNGSVDDYSSLNIEKNQRKPLIVQDFSRLSRPISVGDYPRVYIYDLPKSMMMKTCADVAPQDRSTCKFGEYITLKTPDCEFQIRNTDQFSNAAIFYDRLHAKKIVTKEPTEADIFYIPMYMCQDIGDMCAFCPSVQSIMDNLPYLDKHSAPRHLIIKPDVGFHGCPFYYGRGRDHEQSVLLNDTTRIALESFIERPHLYSIPYPTIASGLKTDELKKLMESVFAFVNRPFLASAIFGMHGQAAVLRQNIMKQCKAVEAAKECSGGNLDEPINGVQRTMQYSQLALNSTFCLQPMGDTPSRKGMLDSMVLGCIPVLFGKNQTTMWPWHVKSWDEVSIFINEKDYNDVFKVLREVPAEKIQSLRRNIFDLIPMISLKEDETQDTYADSFDITIRNLWLLIENRVTGSW